MSMKYGNTDYPTDEVEVWKMLLYVDNINITVVECSISLLSLILSITLWQHVTRVVGSEISSGKFPEIKIPIFPEILEFLLKISYQYKPSK